MKTTLATIAILLLSAWGLTSVAQADRHDEVPPEFQDIGPAPVPAGTTFLTIDITVDPQGQPLGAYQFELTSDNAGFTVIGVEGGDHEAFDHGRPPYFDPVAQQGEIDRLVLAEYAKPALDAEQFPTEAVRVATVHVMFIGPVHEHDSPTIDLALTAAGNAEGERIDATVSHTFRNPERPDAR
ncbi:MAG: hypothetical protein AAGI37_01715 [Planctomycetota bacterium]